MDVTLLGVCGLYCGACYHYRASFPEGAHLVEEAARQGRARQGFACQGCRSDRLYVHPGCAQCQIRACAEEKELFHCGLCVDFPCRRLMDFQSDGRTHHVPVLDQLEALRERGPERWLAERARRWTCTCGARFSWYETVCRQCSAPLDSYASGPR